MAAQIWRIGVDGFHFLFVPTLPSLPDRGITGQYSGGDREMRPKQEILLGVGSCRAIEVPGLEPSIFPRVQITRERRRLAAVLDCVHIIPPSHNVAFAQRAAYCQGWYGNGRGTGRCAAWGRLAFTDRSRWAGVRVEAVDAVRGGDPPLPAWSVRCRPRAEEVL